MAQLVRNYGSAEAARSGVVSGWTSDYKTETDCWSTHWKQKQYIPFSGMSWPPIGSQYEWGGDETSNFATYHVSGNLGSAASHAYNKAVAKLQSQVYDKASTLTALVERRQTWKMVVDRLEHLLKGATMLSQGKFKKFLRHFNARPKTKDVGRVYIPIQKASAYWIEYWFGWAPTAGDIHTAVNTLGAPLPDGMHFEVGSSSFAWNRITGNGGFPGQLETIWEGWGPVSVHIRCNVSVNNYVLFSLEKAGLLNPMVTAWETTPWSWLVDWATNIAQFLGQATRFAGLDLSNITISTVGKFDGEISWIHKQLPLTAFKARKAVLFRRKTMQSLPMVLPHVNIPKYSHTRAATAASLLVLKFEAMRPRKRS